MNKTEYGVSFQRNEGPIDSSSSQYIEEEWSKAFVMATQTKAAAQATCNSMAESGKRFNQYRRVKVVKRTVSAWEAI